jgi:hypothetical protein
MANISNREKITQKPRKFINRCLWIKTKWLGRNYRIEFLLSLKIILKLYNNGEYRTIDKPGPDDFVVYARRSF